MEELKKLIDLKSIVTLILIGVISAGFFMDKIDQDTIKTLTLMVVTFYFGKAQGQNKAEEKEPQNVEGQL